MRFTTISCRALKTAACCFLSLTILLSAGDADAARKRRTYVKGKKPAASAPARAAASGVRDPRYADIIMNPVTGEVYHQDSADERRYPASLTKMMTLYLLFDALEHNKVSMGTHLDISDYAASMPQTNLSLSPGDTIPVEVAIKALVVRSANDVSVVVAEALGGDVDRFAQMMTAKARALGMRNTIFRNPNGLPNNGQVTTARDMVKLGIALKRDFPQYYDYFATRQFSWNGVTYYTHNRVMLRYAGTDGIKTGFIGLSGFNVVTSVTRGGRPLVGAVMGGGSGAWRDNRMIELLDESYRTIAERGAARGKTYPENLPLKRNPKTGASTGVGIQQRGIVEDNPIMPETIPEDRTAAPADTGGEDGMTGEPREAAAPAQAVAPQAAPTAHVNGEGVAGNIAAPAVITPAPAAHPAATHPAPQAAPPQTPTQPATAAPQTSAQAPAQPAGNFIRIVNLPPKDAPATSAGSIAKPHVAPATPPVIPAAPTTASVTPPTKPVPFKAAAPATPAPAPTAPVVNTPAAAPATAAASAPASAVKWGIQVGAFSSNELATRAANDAYGLAKNSLNGAALAIAAPEATGAPIYRARLSGISESQAKSSCQTLIAHSTPCFAYKTH